MRFDLTVPLARFAAQHINELGMPFKRYHIATVWRGENTQRGRYREFMQCDFDTIGTLSPAADIETALVIHDLLLAIGFEDFTIHVNNRLVLNGLLERLGLAEQSARRAAGARQAGTRSAARSGRRNGSTRPAPRAEQAREVLRLAELHGHERRDSRSNSGRSWPAAQRRRRAWPGLAELLAAVKAAGVPESRLRLDVAIARGLDYYTGTIFETFLDQLPRLGSVCSGRPLRQSGRAVHEPKVARHRRQPGLGPAAGRHGRAGHVAESGHAGRGVHPVFRRRAAARLFAAGRPDSPRRIRRRSLSRAEEAGPAVEICRPPRLPRGAGGRRKRIGRRHGAGQESGDRPIETVPLDAEAWRLLAVLRGMLGKTGSRRRAAIIRRCWQHGAAQDAAEFKPRLSDAGGDR